MIILDKKYTFSANTPEYDGDMVNVGVEVHAQGETEARMILMSQGFTDCKLEENPK